MSVVIDLARGQARIADRELPVAIGGPGGELLVGGEGGARLKPLSFGDRSRLVALAAAAVNPREALARAVADASSAGAAATDLDALVIEALALHLAGAGDPTAPPFANAALAVARGAGWSPAALAAAEAAEVDRLAAALGVRADAAPGWTRIVFGAAAAGGDVAALRDELADDLLRRGRPAVVEDGPRDPRTAAAEAPHSALRAAGSTVTVPTANGSVGVAAGGHPTSTSGTPAAAAPAGPVVLRARFAPRAVAARRGSDERTTAREAAPRAVSPSPAAGQATGAPAATTATMAVAPTATGAPPAIERGASSSWPPASTQARSALGVSPASSAAGADRPIALDPLRAAGPDRAEPARSATARPSARERLLDQPALRGLDDRRAPHDALDLDAVADTLARLLHDEADLRGLDR